MSAPLNDAMAPTRMRRRNNKASKNQKWTPEEDAKLRSIVLSNPNQNWKTTAQEFPNKSTQQVFERWTKVLDPTLTKGSWTRNEDQIIIDFVQQFGTKSWTKLAEHLPGRIGKQCRERWVNHLNPDLDRGPWTEEEDQTLLKLHETYGNKWAKIASHMPHRADNAIKNRWYSAVCKRAQTLTQLSPSLSVPVPIFEDPSPSKISQPETPESPTLLASAFGIFSPFGKCGGSSFTPKLQSPISPKLSSPSLSENRAELMNLLLHQ